MAVLVETCEVMEGLLSRRKGEGEEMWRQRLEDNLQGLLHESSSDGVGAMFSFTFGQDVVWYRVVLDEPLSIERLPGPCEWGIDPFTIETLTSRMVRKLSANSKRSLMAMETAFRHEAEAY